MIIAFTAFNTQGEIQDFMCQLESLEAGFDVISSVVVKGNRLLKAVLIDEEGITPLPLDAFDGQPLLKPIQQLELQWKCSLSKHINYTHQVHDFYRQRIQLHYRNIIMFEQAVYRAEQRLRLVEKSRRRTANYILIVHQLERALERCKHNLAAEKVSLQRYTKIVDSASV